VNFDLTDEQRLLTDSVEKLLSAQYTFDRRKRHAAATEGWSRAIWQEFADLGLLGLTFPEELGGFDATPVETMLVMQAFGRHLVVEPYLAGVVLAGGLIAAKGSAAQKRSLLPRIANGKLVGAFAHGERHARYEPFDIETRARRDGTGWVIDGTKSFVIQGSAADLFVVSARVSGIPTDRDGLALFLVQADSPGLRVDGYATRDGSRAADLVLDGVRVGADGCLGEPGNAAEAVEATLAAGAMASCADAVGAMQAALDLTATYLKTRKQFGVPLATFQALQHRLVDMMVALEQARSITMLGTIELANDPAARDRAVSAAKYVVGIAARKISQEAVQLHGGIGMTDEYVVSHLFRRLSGLEKYFGDTSFHLERLAAAEERLF
jgi:alkylation response protein AidB-like acyl-CoA dehydrogenase